jgi:hypothetical protein
MFGRAGTITAAAILFLIFGIVGIAGSIFLFVASAFPASFAGIPFIGGMVSIATWILIVMGILALAPGILSIVAGYLLWKNKRSGGILGIIPIAIQLTASALTFLLPVLWVGGVFGIAISIILLALILIGWKTLR